MLPPRWAALVISLQGFCALRFSKAFTPKRHRGWRKLQMKVLPFHSVSKRFVLKRSYEITELPHGDLPGKRCSCPTSETKQKKIPNPLMLCWERVKKKRNLFNSVFLDIFLPFLSRATSFDTLALRRVELSSLSPPGILHIHMVFCILSN